MVVRAFCGGRKVENLARQPGRAEFMTGLFRTLRTAHAFRNLHRSRIHVSIGLLSFGLAMASGQTICARSENSTAQQSTETSSRKPVRPADAAKEKSRGKEVGGTREADVGEKKTCCPRK